jgi:hypothetical protein
VAAVSLVAKAVIRRDSGIAAGSGAACVVRYRLTPNSVREGVALLYTFCVFVADSQFNAFEFLENY